MLESGAADPALANCRAEGGEHQGDPADVHDPSVQNHHSRQQSYEIESNTNV